MAEWVDYEPNLKARILGKAQEGHWKPETAEKVASRLGVGRLASCPDPSGFDPMSKPTWTLPMAITWISWRTPDHVRECWDKYRRECWEWRWYQSRLPVDGGQEWKEVSGWELKQRSPMTAMRLSILEALSDVNEDASQVVSVKTAREQLWKALEEGCLVAAAIQETSGRPVQISSHEWTYLDLTGDDHLADQLRFRLAPLRIAYREVTLLRTELAGC